MEKIKDLLLLAFWSIAYFLKVAVEIPWLLIKGWFKK
tara:strand:- start:1226 stop:1336 length:111 start_codon:yes stop_codon:yes gene_type:complete